MEPNSNRIVRFGVFEIDLDTRELRKHGLRVKLQDQPFQVLALLLERPGEIITREELQKAVWPEDTFVEFDHGLNTAVQKIRAALGDDASNPRFIETVPKRGYRFLASVEVIGAQTVPPPKPIVKAVAIAASIAALAVGVMLIIDHIWPVNRVAVYKHLTYDSGLTWQPALSDDRTFLAYSSDRAGASNLDIWIQPVTGLDALRLSDDEADDTEPTFSPNRQSIAFRSEREPQGIYSISTLGGAARFIAKDGRRPRFSPDGKWLAFWSGYHHSSNGLVHVAPAAGGASRVLGRGAYPVWSPSGDSLLMLIRPENPTEEWDWWVQPLDGSDYKKTGAFQTLKRHGLEPPYAGERAFVPAAWQKKTNRVIFEARSGDAIGLWWIEVSPKTGHAIGQALQLTSGPEIQLQPSVASDGTVAFTSQTRNADIWALPVNGDTGVATGEPAQLTSNKADDSFPVLSADGRTIVFASNRSGNWDIWKKDLESGAEIALTSSPGDEISPRISRDGSNVVYVESHEPNQRWVFLLGSQNGMPRKLCEDACAGPTDWKPDGTGFLFYGAAVRVETNIGLFRLATGEIEPLLRGAEPRWSPDGNWIAFHNTGGPDDSRPGGRTTWTGYERQVFICPYRKGLAPARSEWVAITNDKGTNWNAAWSPDGNLLYFYTDHDGFRCIRAQRLAPGTKRPTGDAFFVFHSHGSRRNLVNIESPGKNGLTVTKDKIVFAMGEQTGNIWILEPADE